MSTPSPAGPRDRPMLLAHVFGLPLEEFLGSLASGGLPAASVLAIASLASLLRRRTG